MKRSRFTEEQVIAILKEQEAGISARPRQLHRRASNPRIGLLGVYHYFKDRYHESACLYTVRRE